MLHVKSVLSFMHVFTICVCIILLPGDCVIAQEGGEIVIPVVWGHKISGVAVEQHRIDQALDVDKVARVFLVVRNGASVPLMIKSGELRNLPGSGVSFPKEPVSPRNIGVVEIQLTPAMLTTRQVAEKLILEVDTSLGKFLVTFEVTFSSVSNFALPTNLVRLNERGDQVGNIPLAVSSNVKLEQLQFRLSEAAIRVVTKVQMVNGRHCVTLHVDRDRIEFGHNYDLEIVQDGKVVGTTKLVFGHADSVTVSPATLTMFREALPDERDKFHLRGFLLLVSDDLHVEYAADYICGANDDVRFDSRLVKLSEGKFRVEVRCELGLFEEMNGNERHACKLVVRQSNFAPRVFARPLHGQIGDVEQ